MSHRDPGTTSPIPGRRLQLASRPPARALLAALLVGLGACEPAEPGPTAEAQAALRTAGSDAASTVLEVTREHVTGDIVHYSIVLGVGAGPHDRLRLHRIVRERAVWWPHPAAQAILLLHGDFATFSSNFAPSLVGAPTPPRQGLAVYLAEQGLDVWGLDRRWTSAPEGATDLADFAEMGFASAIEDIGRTLAFARSLRSCLGKGGERLFLGGFSRGAHLAYEYAAAESQRPARERHVKGLVPIDVYARLSPEDEPLRQAACARRDETLAAIAAGTLAGDNTFFSALGTLAASAPDQPSPLFPGVSNRDAMLGTVAQTYQFYGVTPVYHLAGAELQGGAPVRLRYAQEGLIDAWLAAAPPLQANREIADSEARWCAGAPLADPLRDIDVPLFYVGAAGGFGEHGLYTTTLVRSRDVSTRVVRLLPGSQEAEDFGHADLLYGDDAKDLAWRHIAAWIQRH